MLATTAAPARTATQRTANSKEATNHHKLVPDPFVCSSPLVAAMVCKDGIALLASHMDEPLQFDASDEDTNVLDLPFPSYNQRIMRLGRCGSALITCGWRADGHGRLLDKARSMITKNVETFGNEGLDTLPHELSLYMTSCAGSETLRTLSCAALLACSPSGDISRTPYLWLVDETGATAVRGMCLGGGYKTQNSTRTAVAADVQKELSNLLERQEDSSMLYYDMNAEAGLAALIKILREQDLIRPKMRLELAIVPSSKDHQQIQRRTIFDILQQQRGT